VITWTPFQLSTDFLVISVYLFGAGEQITLVNNNNDDASNCSGYSNDVQKKTNHGPYVRHEISFRCLKTKVDRFRVFANDYTATGVVSSGEKEIIGTSSRRH
jgi:hypothetical protein